MVPVCKDSAMERVMKKGKLFLMKSGKYSLMLVSMASIRPGHRMTGTFSMTSINCLDMSAFSCSSIIFLPE